jgi:hypothetical protein
VEVEFEHHQHPFTSVKDLILHILTISLGISLALAGEAALEHRQHHELVAETREAFHNQIDDNRMAVTENMKALADTQARLQKVLTLVDTDFVAARQEAISAQHPFIDLDTDSLGSGSHDRRLDLYENWRSTPVLQNPRGRIGGEQVEP